MTGDAPRVREATARDLDALAALFDRYRVFYGQRSDPAGARDFVAARLARGESRLLLAEAAGRAAGFAQLYPCWSSVAMRPIWILNDLYVAAGSRRRGAGRALLAAARELARRSGAKRLELTTARTNAAAQRLYRAAGWIEDEEFLRFSLPVD